ncbi:MAG TPA: TetR/AcrR family transcriptional regulator [Acidiferrobacterales bacterium]
MARKPASPPPSADAARILDAAIELAEAGSWEAVRLHDVAQTLGIGLEDIGAHYREKEDLVEAWFDRADRAMLLDAATPEFTALGTRERLARAIFAWLEPLAAHRRVTREMIINKLEPGHLHFQIPALLRISRTVQWLREAAGRESTFVWRALEETATTAIFVATFCGWLYDDSGNAARSRAFLDRRLRCAETFAHRVYGAGRKPAPPGHDAPRP